MDHLGERGANGKVPRFLEIQSGWKGLTRKCYEARLGGRKTVSSRAVLTGSRNREASKFFSPSCPLSLILSALLNFPSPVPSLVIIEERLHA